MKKLLYINLDFIKYQNKIRAQVKSFKKNNIQSEIFTLDNKNDKCFFQIFEYKNADFVKKYEKEISKAYIVEQGKNSVFALFDRLIRTIKINRKFKNEVLKNLNNNYDYCYIRRIGFFVIFLKSMFKNISKKMKIIYEIPTYPLDKYDNFLINLSQKIEMLCFNLYIKRYISIIPVILQNNVKLDKKMMPLSNAIEYDKFKKVSEEKPQLKKNINMIILAHILPWHGYDRLIESIKNYDGEYTIKLDIYSEINPETIKLKKMVEEYKLSNINFKGSVSLDDIIKKIPNYHIAIGSLGYHRRNGIYDTSIKNKEYCALGLPFVNSAIDLSFKDDFKYFYKVDANDDPFSIDKVIEWYKNIYQDDYKKIMRNYAKNELTYDNSYKSIFNKIEKGD